MKLKMRTYAIILASLSFLCATLSAQLTAQNPIPPQLTQVPPQELAARMVPPPYEVLPGNRVTFRLKAPDATKVEVKGEWPGGLGGSSTIPMTKDDKGIWSVTTGPLPSDVWSFSFAVNGAQVMPSFGPWIEIAPVLGANHIAIPGPLGSDYAFSGSPRGTILYAQAPFMGTQRQMEVFLPPGYYENPAKKFPVLYLTMGGAGYPGTGENPEFVLLENMIASHRAVPMIVVTFSPSAPGGDSLGYTPGGGNKTSPKYILAAQAIVDEIVPYVDKAFRTIPDRDHRAIGGFSSAGAQGFMAGARNPDKFANIFTFSGGFSTWPGVEIILPEKLDPTKIVDADRNAVPDMDKLGALIPKLNASANMKFVALYVGTAESLISTHHLMTKFLDDRGVKYIATENSGYAHEGRNIRVSFDDLVPRLFK